MRRQLEMCLSLWLCAGAVVSGGGEVGENPAVAMSSVPAMRLMWFTPILELPLNEPTGFADALAARATTLYGEFRRDTQRVIDICAGGSACVPPPPDESSGSLRKEAWLREHLNNAFHTLQRRSNLFSDMPEHRWVNPRPRNISPPPPLCHHDHHHHDHHDHYPN